MTIKMYSLYTCDEWYSDSSMSLELESLDKNVINKRIQEIIKLDPEIYNLEDRHIDPDHDDLVELVLQQDIEYLYLEVREINTETKTVEIVQ